MYNAVIYTPEFNSDDEVDKPKAMNLWDIGQLVSKNKAV